MVKIYQNRGGELKKVLDENELVNRSTNQTIGGTKTFQGTINVPDAPDSENSSKAANTKFVKTAINNLINGADQALDTLKELSQAIGDDPHFVTTINNKIDALDAAAVHKTGNKAETITGNKTFTGATTFSGTSALNGATTVGGTATFNNNATFNKPVTFNDSLTFKKPIALNQTDFQMTVKDTNSDTLRTDTLIKGISSNSAYGITSLFGTAGNTILGSGEGKNTLLTDLGGDTGENVYIISDGGITFYTNANTYANKKAVTLNAAGELSGLSKVTSTSFVGNLTGNVTGNADSATKLATARTIAVAGAVTGSASFNGTANSTINAIWRSCLVGQSGSTTTNPWYKVASYAATTANDDIEAVFLVENTYSTHTYGLLKLHVRTDASKVITATASSLVWLSHTGFTPSDFVLVMPTAASSTFELWTRVAVGYQYRRFTVLSEGNRSGTSIRLTLHPASSAGQAASITTAGTKKESTFTGQASSCTGNSATATKFASAQTVKLEGDVTGSASSQAGWTVSTTLKNSGVTAGSYGPSADATPAYNATFNVPYIKVDAQGRVTAAATRTVRIPASDNTDTKNTAGSTNSLKKLFLIGAESQAANPQTYSRDTAYVGTDGCLYSGGAKVLTSHQSLSNYLTKLTNVSEMGRYIDMHYDNDRATYDYDVRLFVNAQGTAAGGGELKITASKVTAGTFNGALTGNASTATKFASAQSIALTGDVTGSTSSQAGWSITTTLKNSGVTSGSYGPSETSTIKPGYGGTFKVPYITVDTKGRVTSASTKTVQIPASDNTNTTYTIAAGASNGQIKVTPSSGSAYNVSVTGLKNSAFAEADTANGLQVSNGKLQVKCKSGGGISPDSKGALWIDFQTALSNNEDNFRTMIASMIEAQQLPSGSKRYFYVDGGNSGSGIAVSTTNPASSLGTPAKPFKSLQECINYICKVYQINSQTAYIVCKNVSLTSSLVLPDFSKTTGKIVICGGTFTTSTSRGNHTALSAGTYGIQISLTPSDSNPRFGVEVTNGKWYLRDFNVSVTDNSLNSSGGHLAALAVHGYGSAEIYNCRFKTTRSSTKVSNCDYTTGEHCIFVYEYGHLDVSGYNIIEGSDILTAATSNSTSATRRHINGIIANGNGTIQFDDMRDNRKLVFIGQFRHIMASNSAISRNQAYASQIEFKKTLVNNKDVRRADYKYYCYNGGHINMAEFGEDKRQDTTPGDSKYFGADTTNGDGTPRTSLVRTNTFSWYR